MAGDGSVRVQFGAEIGDLVKGMQDMSSTVKSELDKVNDSLSKLDDTSKKTTQAVTDSTKQMQTAFATLQTTVSGAVTGIQTVMSGLMTGMKGLMAVLAGGELFKGAVDGTIKWNEECAKLSRTLGVTMNSASVLNTGLRLVGTDADTYASSLMKLDRQLKSNEAGLVALGMVTRDSTGALVDGQAAMKNAITTIQEYKVGQDQNIISQKLFGRSAAEVAPLLKLTDEVMAKAAKTAETLGLKVGVDNVKATRQYQMALNEFKLVLTSIEMKIGADLIPALDKMAFYLNSVGPAASQTLVAAIKVIISVLDVFTSALRISGSAFAAWAGTVYAGLSRLPGQIDAIKDKTGLKLKEFFAPDLFQLENGPRELDSVNKEIAANQRGLSETIDAIWKNTGDNMVSSMKGAKDRISGLFVAGGGDLPKYGGGDQVYGKGGDKTVTEDMTGGGKGGGKGNEEMAQWEQELQRMKDSQSDLNAWSAQKDYEFWNTKLATTKQGSDQWWAIWQKMADLYRTLTADQKKELDKQAKDQIDTARSVAEMRKSDAETAIKIEQGKLDTLFNLGQISATKRTQLETQLYNKEYQGALQAQYQELALVQQKGDTTLAEQAKIYVQIEKLQNEHLLKMQKSESQSLVAMKQDWDRYATQAGSAITGLLFKQQTMLQTMQNLTQRVFTLIIDTLLKKMVNAWIMSEATKTAATTAGVAARTAAESTGSATSFVAQAAAMLKSITASAGETFAGIFGFLSPVMGPAAAVPAGAGMATVLGVAKGLVSLDVGAWEIPHNMVAQLHQGETVVPKSFAEGMRNGGGIGGGGLNVHSPQFHFHGDHWEEGIKKNPSVLYKAIRDGVRDNHLGWRK